MQCVDFGVARWFIITAITVMRNLPSRRCWGETKIYVQLCFPFFPSVPSNLNECTFMLAFDNEGAGTRIRTECFEFFILFFLSLK